MRALLGLVMVVAGLVILDATGDAQDVPVVEGNHAVEEQAVRSTLAQIQDAAQSLDAEKLFSYVLENDKGALIEDGKVLLTRGSALEATRQGLQGLREVSYRFDQQHVTLLSPTIALAVGEGVSTATTSTGRNLSVPFAQSVVLVKSGGVWKVAHAHRSIPPAN